MGEASQEKSGADVPHFGITEFGSHFVIRVERLIGFLACKQDIANELANIKNVLILRAKRVFAES